MTPACGLHRHRRLYANMQLTPKVAVAGRYEYLNDHDGFATFVTSAVAAAHLNEFTGTLERTLRRPSDLPAGVPPRRLESELLPRMADGQLAVGGQDTVDAGLVFVLEPRTVRPNQAVNTGPPIASR